MKITRSVWLERAVSTHNFHARSIRKDSSHRTSDTAVALKMSIGAVSQNLLIARWLRHHEKELNEFNHAYEAIKWIREKERLLESEEIV